jgi:hypothetical protein
VDFSPFNPITDARLQRAWDEFVQMNYGIIYSAYGGDGRRLFYIRRIRPEIGAPR